MSVTVNPIPDGPLMVKGDAAYLCRCGASANKPLCDGGHEKIGFKGYARIFDLKGERTGR